MALPQLSIQDTTADEASGRATFDVVLDSPSQAAVTVEWATANSSDPDAAYGASLFTVVNGIRFPLRGAQLLLLGGIADYYSDFGTLTFAAGETRKSIVVGVATNWMPDAPEETFSVVLSNAAGAEIADATAVGTILDKEYHTPPRIGFEYAEADEPYHGLGASAALLFRVWIGNAYVQNVTVDYATRDAGATAGADYTAIAGTLTFAPGETEKWLSVPVLADTEAEADEQLMLVFSNPQGGTLDPDWPAEAPGLIRDIPVPPPEPVAPHFAMVMNRALTFPLALPLASPVSGLAYLLVTADADEAVLATGLGDFLNTRGGNDAANGADGGDVLDGGNGGNILTGGAGTDLFFIDARVRDQPVWTTVTDLEPGERAVLWGLTEPDFTLEWADGWGLPGLGGLTLLARGTGQPVALTLTGYTQLDMQTGYLATAFGHDPASGQDYFYVAAV